MTQPLSAGSVWLGGSYLFTPALCSAPSELPTEAPAQPSQGAPWYHPTDSAGLRAPAWVSVLDLERHDGPLALQPSKTDADGDYTMDLYAALPSDDEAEAGEEVAAMWEAHCAGRAPVVQVLGGAVSGKGGASRVSIMKRSAHQGVLLNPIPIRTDHGRRDVAGAGDGRPVWLLGRRQRGQQR